MGPANSGPAIDSFGLVSDCSPFHAARSIVACYDELFTPLAFSERDLYKSFLPNLTFSVHMGRALLAPFGYQRWEAMRSHGTLGDYLLFRHNEVAPPHALSHSQPFVNNKLGVNRGFCDHIQTTLSSCTASGVFESRKAENINSRTSAKLSRTIFTSSSRISWLPRTVTPP